MTDVLQKGDRGLCIGQRVKVNVSGPFEGRTGRVFSILPHKFGVVVELDVPWVEDGALACFNPEELEPAE